MQQEKQHKSKKSGRLFVFVSAIVTANLAYWLIQNIISTVEGAPACAWCWALVGGNVIAIIGMLWLVQNNRKRRRIEREAQEKTNDKDSAKG